MFADLELANFFDLPRSISVCAPFQVFCWGNHDLRSMSALERLPARLVLARAIALPVNATCVRLTLPQQEQSLAGR